MSKQEARLINEFRDLSTPLNEWLRKNFHPHMKIVIGQDYAEIIEEAMGINFHINGREG